jgi:hypothetical protein
VLPVTSTVALLVVAATVAVVSVLSLLHEAAMTRTRGRRSGVR